MCVKVETNQDVPHAPRLFIDLEVRDKDGNVIQRHRQEGKSFLWNLIGFLWQLFQGNNSVNLYEPSITTGSATCETTCSVPVQGSYFSVVAPSGTTQYGIVIGGSNTSNTTSVCSLYSPLTSGISYGATSVASQLTINSTQGTISFTITRQFQNNSGSSITVQEVGIAIQGNGCYPVLARDVLSSAVSVPNGGTLTVTYTIQLTIS